MRLRPFGTKDLSLCIHWTSDRRRTSLLSGLCGLALMKHKMCISREATPWWFLVLKCLPTIWLVELLLMLRKCSRSRSTSLRFVCPTYCFPQVRQDRQYMMLFDLHVTFERVLYCLPVTLLVIVPVLFNRRQYWQGCLVHLLLVSRTGFGSFRLVVRRLTWLVGGGWSRGSRALTSRSLRFFALLLPLMTLRFIRGLVELDLSSRSQFRVNRGGM